LRKEIRQDARTSSPSGSTNSNIDKTFGISQEAKDLLAGKKVDGLSFELN
jgi:hypothetical protein